MNLEAVAEWLADETGIRITPDSATAVAGGCIHETRLVDRLDGGSVFLKINRAESLPMFEAEQLGLKALASSGAIRVPLPLAAGTVGESAVLAMEGIPMANRTDDKFQGTLGKAMAALHATSGPKGLCGFDNDNFIGATPQPNEWSDSWADFFTERRLGYQLQLASKNGRTFQETGTLLGNIHNHLASLEIAPSLLHGDLWGGNVAFDATGTPVIFDPAVYFGDREADIAFTRMFGGFGPAFYETYREHFPPPEPVRERIYNLYHVLNHFNLFGGSYADQAARIMADIRSTL